MSSSSGTTTGRIRTISVRQFGLANQRMGILPLSTNAQTRFLFHLTGNEEYGRTPDIFEIPTEFQSIGAPPSYVSGLRASPFRRVRLPLLNGA